MPQMVAIAAALADATPVELSPMSAAAGDKTEAVWHATGQAQSLAARPVLTHSVQWNGPRTARRHHIKMVAPVTNQEGVVTDRAIFDLTCTVPAALTDATVDNSFALFTSALVAPVIKTSIKEGFAAS